MKILVLKDMDDGSILRILSCADNVDTKALSKKIFDKEYDEVDDEIRDIDDVCAELQSEYDFKIVENFRVCSV